MFIHSNLSLNLDARLEHFEKSKLYQSSDYTFFIIQQGSVHMKITENTKNLILEKNDFILLHPGTSVTCNSHHTNTIIQLTLDSLFMQSITPLSQQIYCNSVTEQNSDDEKLRDILLRICAAYITISDRALMISLIYELIDILKHGYMKELDITDIHSKKEELSLRLSQITEYITSHSHTKISLNDLADELYLSPQYLSKFIKKNLNSNFSTYLTQIRLKNAVNSLENTDTSITLIALDCGFSNLTSFNRIFKAEYLMSPTAYRNNFKKNLIQEPQPVNSIVPLTEDLNKSKRISISCKNSVVFYQPWRETVNIGILSHAQRHSFHENFNTYHKNTLFQYVRFSNMFAEELVSYNVETDEFDFSSLEVLIASFQRRNVIPFIELSFKPVKGFVDISENLPDYYLKEKESSFYYTALDLFLRHAVNHFGHSYVRQWKFEIWYKFDEDLVPAESVSDYMKKYQTYENIIHAIVPECRIGGPGFNMSGRFEDFMMIMGDLMHSNIHFDFISFTGYCYKLRADADPKDRSVLGILSPDPDHLKSTMKLYYDYLERIDYYKGISICLTEFGSILSVRNYIPESLYQAAFIAKTALDLSEFADQLVYSYFTDSHQPLSASDRTVYSFPGLIGENGIAKPSYHAFSLLFGLGKQLVSKGRDYILTRNSENQYQFLCFHYVHFSKNFCLNSWEKVDITQTYDIFEKADMKSMNITLTDIQPGKYKMTRFSLNRNYGSILDKYLRIIEASQIPPDELMSIISNLREEEVTYYKKTSYPRQDISIIECKMQLELDLMLEPHEVVFFELNRIL